MPYTHCFMSPFKQSHEISDYYAHIACKGITQRKVSIPSKHQEYLKQRRRVYLPCHTHFPSVPAPTILGLDSPIHEKCRLLPLKAKGNSGQGCKMVAKEMCALGVPRVLVGSFLPHKSFYTERTVELCPLLQVFYIIWRAHKEGACVMHVCVCVFM